MKSSYLNSNDLSDCISVNVPDSQKSVSSKDKVTNIIPNTDTSQKNHTQTQKQKQTRTPINKKLLCGINSMKAFSMFDDSKILFDIIQLKPFSLKNDEIQYYLKNKGENNSLNNVSKKSIKYLSDGAFQLSLPVNDNSEGVFLPSFFILVFFCFYIISISN